MGLINGEWQHDCQVLIEEGKFRVVREAEEQNARLGYFSHPDLAGEVAAVVYGENETVFFCSDWRLGQPEMNDLKTVALSSWRTATGYGTLMLNGLPFLPPFLTLAQAAELSGLSPSRLRHKILSGTLKATKMGRDWIVIPKDLPSRIRAPKKI